MKTSLASIIAKLLSLLATAALATPIMPMGGAALIDSPDAEANQKRAFGLTSPAHVDTPYFGRPVIGNYQSEIDAADPDEVLGKKHRKGSKGLFNNEVRLIVMLTKRRSLSREHLTTGDVESPVSAG